MGTDVGCVGLCPPMLDTVSPCPLCPGLCSMGSRGPLGARAVVTEMPQMREQRLPLCCHARDVASTGPPAFRGLHTRPCGSQARQASGVAAEDPRPSVQQARAASSSHLGCGPGLLLL